MSRHRNMRHMIAEDDYYDDDYYDDDDYDDYDDYGGANIAAPKKKSTTSTTSTKTTPASTSANGGGGKKKKKKGTATTTTPAKGGAAATTTAKKTTSSTQQPSLQQTQKKTATTTTPSSTSTTLEVVVSPTSSAATKKASSSSISVIAAATTAATTTPPPPPPGFGSLSPTPAAAAATSASSSKAATSTTTSTTTTATTTSTAAIPDILLKRQSKPSLTCVVLGHVDAGKSTLTGHLLWKAGKTTPGGGSSSMRQPPTNFAWLLDEDEEERKHGVTMDVATKVLTSTCMNYNIQLQDAPGHADYVPCMITGTANADAAIVVVDVTDRKTLQPLLQQKSTKKSEHSTGGSSSSFIGQLREHLVLAKGLGISQLIVVINKMDVRDWDAALYEEVKRIVQDFLVRQLGFASKKINFLPASGLTGTNIMEKPGANVVPELSSWYKGDTLFQALDKLELPGAAAKANAAGGAGKTGGGLLAKPLRIVLTDVGVGGTDSNTGTNKRGVSVRGKVLAGWVKAGQQVTLLPAQDTATVQKLSRLVDVNTSTMMGDDDKDAQERSLYGAAGEVVDLVLTGVDLARLAVGTLVAPFSNSPTTNNLLPTVSNRCRCKIYVLDALPIPIIRGATASFHMHHLDVPCHVSKLIETISTANNNNNNDAAKKKRPPRALTARTTALVEITLMNAIALETFADCRPLGRFVLRRGGDSIAVGRIEQVLVSSS